MLVLFFFCSIVIEQTNQDYLYLLPDYLYLLQWQQKKGEEWTDFA